MATLWLISLSESDVNTSNVIYTCVTVNQRGRIIYNKLQLSDFVYNSEVKQTKTKRDKLSAIHSNLVKHNVYIFAKMSTKNLHLF